MNESLDFIIKNIKLFFGALCLFSALCLCMWHAENNYGVADSSDPQVLAQTGTTGGGTSGGTGGVTAGYGTDGGGWNWPWNWGQGGTKDEYSVTTQCSMGGYSVSITITSGSAGFNVSFPTTGGVNVSGGAGANTSTYDMDVKQYETTGQKVACFDGGHINCSDVACK